jgi:hypothetical protein
VSIRAVAALLALALAGSADPLTAQRQGSIYEAVDVARHGMLFVAVGVPISAFEREMR